MVSRHVYYKLNSHKKHCTFKAIRHDIRKTAFFGHELFVLYDKKISWFFKLVNYSQTERCAIISDIALCTIKHFAQSALTSPCCQWHCVYTQSIDIFIFTWVIFLANRSEKLRERQIVTVFRYMVKCMHPCVVVHKIIPSLSFLILEIWGDFTTNYKQKG
jgi:hypothetical protein